MGGGGGSSCRNSRGRVTGEGPVIVPLYTVLTPPPPQPEVETAPLMSVMAGNTEVTSACQSQL